MNSIIIRLATVLTVLLFAFQLQAQTENSEVKSDTSPETPAAKPATEAPAADAAPAAEKAEPVENTEKKAEEAPAEAVPVDEPATDEPPVDEPPVDEPATDEPPVDDSDELDSIDSLDELEELEELESLEGAELADKEQLKFFELNGYYRFRADLFHRLDIGVFNDLRLLGDAGTTTGDQDNDDRDDNTVGTANMRLRLSPTLNVSEDIKIKADIDLLDNIVLGTTPDTYLRGTSALAPGISGFSSAQVPPRWGSNSDTNSIEVKRVWAEVRTPVGLLKFGRMPSHWGTGMFINDGNCIDCDYGDTVDRVLFGTKLFEHILFVGMDWVNEGITNDTTFEYGGQDKDATNLDDVYQLVFGFARKNSDAEAEELIENNDFVINYGFYNVIRWQSYSIENTQTGGSSVGFGNTPAGDYANRQTRRSQLIERNLKLYIGDLWAKFLWKRLHLEFEVAWVTGSMGNAAKDSTEFDPDSGFDNSLDVDQFGMVFQADYKFLDDSLFLGVEWGLASGDPYPGQNYADGFGVYPYQDPQFGGKYQRVKGGPMVEDRSVNNFRFDPDYHVDLILFREIIGTVTDATYLKPSVMYNITPSIGARLDMIFSWAMEADSTPSYDHKKYDTFDDFQNDSQLQTTVAERKTSKWLGFELDIEIFYKSFDGFGTGLQYGVFFPGPAFGYWDPGYVDSNGNVMPTWFDAPDIAQSLQWRLSVEF